MDAPVTLRRSNRAEILETVDTVLVAVVMAVIVVPQVGDPGPLAPLVVAGTLFVGGLLVVLGSLRLPHTDEHPAARLRDLEPASARRALRRELWHGRPGPPGTWPFARAWAAHRLQQRRTDPGWWLCGAGIYLELYVHNSPPWPAWAGLALLPLVGVPIGEAVLILRAARIARALVDNQPARPCPGPWPPSGEDTLR